MPFGPLGSRLIRTVDRAHRSWAGSMACIVNTLLVLAARPPPWCTLVMAGRTSGVPGGTRAGHVTALGVAAALETRSGPELDETVLDHGVLAATGLESEATVMPVEDLDFEVVAQE